jgi:hypothetical protein
MASKQCSYSEMKDDGSGCEEVVTDGVWLLGNTSDTSGGRGRWTLMLPKIVGVDAVKAG